MITANRFGTENGAENGSDSQFNSGEREFRWSVDDSDRIKRIQFGGARILLVDDSEDNRLLFQRILAAAGAKVELAFDGFEAVRMQAEKDFEAIIMDIRMPQLDGRSATRLIRANGYTGPIIALTAHANPGEEDRCRDAGCSSFFLKPIDRLALLSAVESAIRMSNEGVRT